MKFLGKTFSGLSKVFLYIWCGFSVFCLVWVLYSSLKTNREFFAEPWGMFKSAQWENYANVWTNNNLSGSFVNSLYVVTLSVILILVVCTPAAYALSRIKFRLNKPITYLIVLGMGIPYQLLLVPLYFIMYNWGLVNNLNGLVIVYVALSIPFTVFLQMGFFKTLPSALAEAACIDGCGPIRTFFKVMLPLGRPAIITAAIFNFISLWNEFLLALTFLNDSNLFTLPVGLFGMQTSMQYTGNWVGLFAGFVIILIPTLVIYIILSKRIITGLTMGAVKE